MLIECKHVRTDLNRLFNKHTSVGDPVLVRCDEYSFHIGKFIGSVTEFQRLVASVKPIHIDDQGADLNAIVWTAAEWPNVLIGHILRFF